MFEEFGIDKEILNLANQTEEEIKDVFKEIDKICEYNSLKVLNAFRENNISEMHFNQTKGYKPRR